MSLEKFKSEISSAFSFSGKNIVVGGAMYDGASVPGSTVKLSLSTINRHGLIAGATGTGKTKSIQRLAESLSEQGVNTLLMDIKGDISGIAKAGTINQRIDERMKTIGVDWEPTSYPVELMTISDEKGIRMRATVSEFGPVLFFKNSGTK